MYEIREVVYRPIDVDPALLLTVTEAAKLAGMTKSGIIRAMERGVLTEIVDRSAGYRGRRLLREEVEKLMRARAERRGE